MSGENLEFYPVSSGCNLLVYLSLTCVGSDQDYVQWLAHSDDISDPNDGCILGYKEKFRRLRKDSVCLNGRDYVVNAVQTPCLCTLDDFLWYDSSCSRSMFTN